MTGGACAMRGAAGHDIGATVTKLIKMLPLADPTRAIRHFAIPPRRWRPEGSLAALTVSIVSKQANDEDIARDLAGGSRVGHRAEDWIPAVLAAEFRTIDLQIDCSGGDADGANVLIRALLDHPWRVRAHIVGRCHSTAPLIALAADTVTIEAGATVMFHRPYILLTQEHHSAVLDAPVATRQKIIDDLNELEDFDVCLIAARMAISQDAARAILAEGREWPACQAIDNGFANRIFEARAA